MLDLSLVFIKFEGLYLPLLWHKELSNSTSRNPIIDKLVGVGLTVHILTKFGFFLQVNFIYQNAWFKSSGLHESCKAIS